MDENPYKSPLTKGSEPERSPNGKARVAFQVAVVLLNTIAAIYMFAKRPHQVIAGICFTFCAVAVLATMRVRSKPSPRLASAPDPAIPTHVSQDMSTQA